MSTVEGVSWTARTQALCLAQTHDVLRPMGTRHSVTLRTIFDFI